MEISGTAAMLIIALVVIALFLLGGCGTLLKKDTKDDFTRTCMTADTNCRFVRSPVDYAENDITEVPIKKGKIFPHFMGFPGDKAQPLEDGHVVLINDEKKLYDQDLLWKQYESSWKGCGNGKPYIVNDEKTRWTLRGLGDEAAVRMMESQPGPGDYGPPGRYPVVTDQDLIQPEPFDSLYGGDWLDKPIGT